MLRVSIIAALLLAVPAFPAFPATQEAAPEQGKCADTPQKKAKRSMFGSILGGFAGGVLGQAGGMGGMAASLIPVGSILADELLKLLDCKEQKQAANATTEAIRGGVGTEVKWQSETRQNVSGVSKVTGEQQLADGTHCMTVTDVVIIDGEETTVPKQMCRGQGDSGYRKA
jgi:predicted lipid-binding transport protein (Tim44 family)